MTVLLLAASLIVILTGCEGFTNGIEWFGKKHGLGEGAVGSILAAVGTALPETLVPLVAIVLTGGNHGEDIGIGAILGAPFMLSTLAMFVTGAALVIFHFTRKRQLNPRVNSRIVGRDLTFFLCFYTLAIAAGILHLRPLSLALAPLLWLGYVVYVYLTLKTEGDLDGETRELYFHRNHLPELPHPPRIIAQIVLSLAAIVLGARLFVDAVGSVADFLGLPALVVSMLITPIATELPEKFNSVIWIRARKDTLALGNITGAMVFQSVFPVSVGLLLTDWRLSGVAVVSAALALGSGLMLLLWMWLRKTLAWWMLLLGGAWYTAFAVYAVVSNL